MTKLKLEEYGIPEDEAALVTGDNMDDLYLMLPKDEHMPDGPTEVTVFLTAVFLRFHKEEEFVQEMIEWLGKEQDADEGEMPYIQ